MRFSAPFRSLAIVLSLAAVALAQAPTDAEIHAWINGPDHADIDWHVFVTPPRLIFDQRQLVYVAVAIPAKKLQKNSVARELYFVVKATDTSGRWYSERSAGRGVLTQPLDGHSQVSFTTPLLMRPGRHKVAVVLYDAVLRQYNVAHKWITVRDIPKDPLPVLDENLPDVDFLNARTHNTSRPGAVPRGKPQSGGGNDDSRAASASGEVSQRTPGDRRLIPVKTQRPVLIDVLVDYTPSAQYTGRRGAYRFTAQIFWEITHVLSLLDPSDGCVRLTGLDVLGQHVLFEHVDAAHVPWLELSRRIQEIDSATVDVLSLQRRTEMARFFRQQVARMVEHDDRCDPAGPPPQRVFVIAASGMVFPNGTRREPVEAIPPASSRLYYLRGRLATGSLWDEMENIVKPLQPKLVDIDTPLDFRKALARIVNDVVSDTTAQ